METLFTNKRFIKVCTIFITVLCVCALVVLFEIVSGSKNSEGGNNNQNVISFTGHGEVTAVPDIATLSFGLEASDTTQKAAADVVNTKAQKITDFLKSSGVAEKDIKTENYSSYPKYSNPTPCYYSNGIMPPCMQGEAKIIGYTVSENFTVKVRVVDDASKIIDGINKIGVNNMSGPNLTIDNEDALKAEARQKAIDDAKAKATELSKELGVRLSHITSFSENGNYPMPMYAKADMMSVGAGAPAPEISKGENTISSDVTITYEIK